MSVYVGTNNEKKEISSIYANKDKKEIIEAYSYKSGEVNAVYTSKPDPGQQIFTYSGTFTVPKGVKSVDLFLVGGGGKGGTWSQLFIEGQDTQNWGGNGGGGGYTKTVKGVTVTPGNSYSIVVGDGCQSWAYNVTYTGGKSSGLGYSTNGGYAGNSGKGGSGGGKGGYLSSVYLTHGGNGGYNGSNGYGNGENSSSTTANGPSGQGTTTRAFGESSGTLYAGGGARYLSAHTTLYYGIGGSGGGGRGGTQDYSPVSGTANTGGGGGGQYCMRLGGTATTVEDGNNKYIYGSDRDIYCGASGGSGIVIIRWGY